MLNRDSPAVNFADWERSDGEALTTRHLGGFCGSSLQGSRDSGARVLVIECDTSLNDGITRAADVRIGGMRASVCRYSEGCTSSFHMLLQGFRLVAVVQPRFFSHFREVKQDLSELGLPKGMLEILPGVTPEADRAVLHELLRKVDCLRELVEQNCDGNLCHSTG